MSRSRTCIPEAYGGKNCSFLEDQAKKSNQSVYKQVQVCLNLPNCSIPATLTPWSEWSSCTTKCHCPGRSIPQSEKRRSCNEAVLSTAEELNTDITVCSQFEELNMEMKRNCNGTQCTCERDWTLYEDSCFLFGTDEKDWVAAEQFCMKKGGHLASVDSQHLNTFLGTQMKERGIQDFYLGGRRREQEGTWKWTDGGKWRFTFWNRGEPNNAPGNQNCLQQRSSYKWEDLHCSEKRPFVCSKNIKKIHRHCSK